MDLLFLEWYFNIPLDIPGLPAGWRLIPKLPGTFRFLVLAGGVMVQY